jgi:hypothetical protein
MTLGNEVGHWGTLSMLGLAIGGLLIGFIGGYFVRDYISRRRHAAARERAREQKIQLFYQRHPESMGRLNRTISSSSL